MAKLKADGRGELVCHCVQTILFVDQRTLEDSESYSSRTRMPSNSIRSKEDS